MRTIFTVESREWQNRWEMRGNKYQATKRCYRTEAVETSDKTNECNSTYGESYSTSRVMMEDKKAD